MTLRQIDCIFGGCDCNFSEMSEALSAARQLMPDINSRRAVAVAHFESTGSTKMLETIRDELLAKVTT